MRALRALLLGLAAGAVLIFGAALAVAVVAEAGRWDDVRISLGPLVFLEVARGPDASETTFGPGLALLAGACALANALAALLLARRR